jgi:hypothetical protein
MTSPVAELSALLSAGSAITTNFLTELNGDASTLGTQLIGYAQAGSQLLSLGLSQVGSALPTLPLP